MYESFFGFVKRPFLAASTLDRYFPATSVEQACQTASRAIQRGEGPVAIFGGTGLGKTMCCMRIAERFRRNFEVVTLASSQLITRRALLQSLLFELRMPYRDMTEGELRLSLMSRLQPSTDNPTDGLVLIIDEAQTMSMKLLDEIRLLTNTVRNGIPRVRLVLCGTMRLEDCLSHPHMDSLNQRLAARCYLTPLSNQETSQYVIHKIELSGVDGATVMTRESLDAIYRGSDGIPRLIDQLTDQSLLLACTERERPVSAAMVGRAWCMLQQLPNPWSEPESIVKTSPSAIALPDPSSGSVSASNVAMAGPTQAMPSSTGTTQASSVVGANALSQATGLASSFDAMMRGASTPKPSSSHSNVEFGQLDDDFQDDQESVSLATFGKPVSNVESMTTESDFEDTSLAPEPIKQPSKNLLDVFAGDFDEEFNIPVQSSDSYQAYSGASYGNLNYDLSNFGAVNKPVDEATLAFDEANDFFTAPTPSQRLAISSSILDDQEYVPTLAPNLDRDENDYADTAIEAVSNISPEQAANLERQIEEEMRDLVSGLNMSAMMFDPMTTVDPWGNEDRRAHAESAAQSNSDELRLAHLAHTDVIGLAGMHSFSTFSDTEQAPAQYSDRNSDRMGDDRDLLVIEDDLELVRGGVTQAESGSHRAVLHPYAKLFTKLRNS
ncbi:MAG: AAA family ATPase [Planctomycetota bacterium]|nr:AAA family ATPase [Planctomycetota bacterium]